MAPRIRLAVEIGQQFTRLTVLSEQRTALTPGRAAYGFTQGLRGARCRCLCGNEVVVSLTQLHEGTARSCGCLRTETAATRTAAMSEGNIVHGLSRRGRKHPLFGVWTGMMNRCFNPAHSWYARYGGRGITVVDAWKDPSVFIAQLEQEIGPRPEGNTLDRIDNDRGYESGNVRWSTHSEQMINRGKIQRLSLSADQIDAMRQARSEGVKLRELAAKYGVSIASVHRITKETA